MRTVLYLVQKEFLQVFRNRFMLPMLLVMPVVQTVLLSFAANYEIQNLSLGVVDHDLSPMSRQLVARFGASGYFRVKKSAFSIQEADADLARDYTDLILEIPPHFERDFIREGTAGVSITANAINPVKAGLAIGYAQAIVQSEIPPRPPQKGGLELTYSNWYNPRLDYKTFMVPGILGVIISMIICFLTALNIVREREVGTIEQINVTPIRKWQFILGKLLPFWLIALVMMTIGLAVGWLIFRIPMLGDLRLVFLYTLVFAPCMLGLGFLISNFAESQQQAIFTAWFFLVIFILMCGLFTPADSMPRWAQWLNMLNPVKYFVEFMRLVLLKGAGFAEIRQNFFTVLTYGAVVNGLAMWTYRKRV
ncbi:MAG: ABC transporter permease [Saprospirales bacterium]|nr:ABC transporter permease [Saprospirales bacterium]MBK8921515.1 ABC transporter permease [Saprospirales bacterium]